MIIAYSCFAIAWIGFLLSWNEMTVLGRVLFAIIAVATITLVRDAHKARKALYTSHYSDYIKEDHPNDPECDDDDCEDCTVTFNFYSGTPIEHSPYADLDRWYTRPESLTTTSDGCTDPKTSSRKRESFLSDFYEFCEENGYSQEERPLVFQEWVND